MKITVTVTVQEGKTSRAQSHEVDGRSFFGDDTPPKRLKSKALRKVRESLDELVPVD